MNTYLASRPRGEEGSAYIVALLALVVLSIMALSLTLVTRTERQIGSNDKTLHRTLYAADAGLNIGAAWLLTKHDYEPPPFLLNRTSMPGGLNVADRVTLAHIVVVGYGPCNWCPMNDDGAEPAFYRYDHAVNATGERLAWAGPPTVPPPGAKVESEKLVGNVFSFQPWKDASGGVLRPDEKDTIRF